MVGFIRWAIDFIVRPSHSRTMGLVAMLILITAVSLTVYVAQQQQQVRQRAEAPQVCNAIDTIQTCSSNNPENNPCDAEGNRCKIGNTIYECKR